MCTNAFPHPSSSATLSSMSSKRKEPASLGERLEVQRGRRRRRREARAQPAQAVQQSSAEMEDTPADGDVMRLLLALPEELCEHAFKYLSPDDLRACCLLNHELSELASNDELWGPQVASRFCKVVFGAGLRGQSARQHFTMLAREPCSVCHAACGGSETSRPPLARNRKPITTPSLDPYSCENCGQLCCARCNCACKCRGEGCTDPFDEDRDTLTCAHCGGWAHGACFVIRCCEYCGKSTCQDCEPAELCEWCQRITHADCAGAQMDACAECDNHSCQDCNFILFCKVCNKGGCKENGCYGAVSECGECDLATCEDCKPKEKCIGCDKNTHVECMQMTACDSCDARSCKSCSAILVCELCHKGGCSWGCSFSKCESCKYETCIKTTCEDCKPTTTCKGCGETSHEVCMAECGSCFACTFSEIFCELCNDGGLCNERGCKGCATSDINDCDKCGTRTCFNCQPTQECTECGKAIHLSCEALSYCEKCGDCVCDLCSDEMFEGGCEKCACRYTYECGT